MNAFSVAFGGKADIAPGSLRSSARRFSNVLLNRRKHTRGRAGVHDYLLNRLGGQPPQFVFAPDDGPGGSAMQAQGLCLIV